MMRASLFIPALALLLTATTAPIQAQTPVSTETTSAEYSREQYINEIRAYKHDFLARDLELSRERQRAFFQSYDAMEDELLRLNEETRELERSINDNADASDVELEAAAIAIYGQKGKEAEIEARYLEVFKEQLTPRQLVRLRSAERRFNQYLMRHHRRLRSEERSGRGPRR